jgi:hypothetical protein
MEFIEAPAFTRNVGGYLNDEDYRALQGHLAVNPSLGDVMPGTGGFRKLRWQDPRRGKGRRGGLRIIYYYFPAHQQIWLLTLYGKDEAADLTPDEKKALRRAIEAELRLRRDSAAVRPKSGRRF